MSEKTETLKEITVTHKVWGPVGNCVECLLDDIRIVDGVVEVDLWYPPWHPNDNDDDGPENQNPHTVEIGLTAVRSVPSVRVSYSYERNGWVVLAGRWVETTDEHGYPAAEEVFDEVLIPT